MKKVFSVFVFLFAIAIITAEQKQEAIEKLKYAKINAFTSNTCIADEANILAGKNGSAEYFFPNKTHKNKKFIYFGFKVTHPKYGTCTITFCINKVTNNVHGLGGDEIIINGRKFPFAAFLYFMRNEDEDEKDACREFLQWENDGRNGLT